MCRWTVRTSATKIAESNINTRPSFNREAHSRFTHQILNMAAMQLHVTSSSSSSSFSSSCGTIQAVQRRRPATTASAFAFHCVAPVHEGCGPARCVRISGVKNVGRQRLLLPRRDAEVQQLIFKRGSGLGKQGAAGVAMVPVVRASAAVGIVKEVRTEVKGIYYNVTLTVPQSSDVAKWYQTPGQYVDLLPTKSAHNDARSFFIASPTHQIQEGQLVLEFLIEDVAGTVANELINSKPGDSVIVSANNAPSNKGFDVAKLQPIEAAQHVLMFASSYGIGSLRAFIETGFQAQLRKTAVLHTMYAPGQEPYMDKHATWKLKSGVTVTPCQKNIIEVLADPPRTVVLMNATETEQEKLITHFLKANVPYDQILVLWDGIPTTDKTYINKVLGKPNCLHTGELHVPFALKI